MAEPLYYTSPGEAIAARRDLERKWERALWQMLQAGTFGDQRWRDVGITEQMARDARDGFTARAAYKTLLPWVQIAAAAKFNRRQLRYSPNGAQKKWVARMDDRTRPEHRVLNGQKIGLHQPFSVGYDHIYFPGDTSAPIHLWAGCRCVLVITP